MINLHGIFRRTAGVGEAPAVRMKLLTHQKKIHLNVSRLVRSSRSLLKHPTTPTSASTLKCMKLKKKRKVGQKRAQIVQCTLSFTGTAKCNGATVKVLRYSCLR